VTQAARITQADMERATKAVAAAGLGRARIIMDLEKRQIEIIIGESANDVADEREWADDDI
jgi:soluble P-type ATPase